MGINYNSYFKTHICIGVTKDYNHSSMKKRKTWAIILHNSFYLVFKNLEFEILVKNFYEKKMASFNLFSWLL